ncbi:hypothetical protein GTR02_05010 [Kineococcus sp. R8]|uniref:hypothetical protein n=1 Tax=Kineococcus siccus TaxID=2696567 RepID=UPI0014130A66|nr:hypothetical protein [Kineococcus siccus]NAZ81171.1 hypothetical protein [Kineococcus siccus]
MHPELESALGPLLPDLKTPSGVLPTIVDEGWQQYPATASCWLRGPDETATGVFVQTGRPFTEQVVALADQVQEWAVEALWRLGRSASWPACPYHPDRHPLLAGQRAAQAVWTCPVSDVRVSAIGALADVCLRERQIRRPS